MPKNVRWILGLLGIICFSASIGKADNAATLVGAPLFTKKCAMCHGSGTGNAKMAGMLHLDPAKLNLTQSKLSADEIQTLLKTGRNKMPAFKTLTDDQSKSLVTHVLGLRNNAK